MTEKKEIFRKLEEEKAVLDELGVKKLGLFGSFARGDQDTESDIDFVVNFQEGEKTFRNYMDLKRKLEQLFSREVDLVTEESIKPSLKDRITEEVEYA
ncbi:nucleotidyltransferase [Candidatus Nanohaloarchaea archaeon]|nr:nucleotidyltransferase [Candidatus Nanohaloarchaea archaeon]